MSEEETFFVARKGAVWACWLDGRAAVRLGTQDAVEAAMLDYLEKNLSPPAENAGAPQKAAPAPEPRTPPPPPSLAPPSPSAGTQVQRAQDRHEITIIGRIYTASGSREVTILDLSEQGCRFRDRAGRLAVGSQITIKLGPVGPLEASVKWQRDGETGIAFSPPLYPSVLDHIRQHFDLRK